MARRKPTSTGLPAAAFMSQGFNGGTREPVKPAQDSPGDIYRAFAAKFPVPTEGSLRIWWIPQVPGRCFYWPTANLAQAKNLLDLLAAYDDYQFAERVKGDYCNVGGVQIFEGGEWVDFHEEDI